MNRHVWPLIVGGILGTAASMVLATFPAHATLTINAVSKGATYNGNTAYFVSGTGAPSGSFFDPTPAAGRSYGYGAVNVSANQLTNGASGSEQIYFDISSDKTSFTPASGETLVISLTAPSAQNGGAAQYLPIASVAGVSCVGNSNCYTGGKTGAATGQAHAFAVYFPGAGSTVRIGVYPQDLCSDFYAQSGNIQTYGCGPDPSDGARQTVLSSTNALVASSVMTVTFQINAVDGAQAFTATAAQDKLEYQLRFQSDASVPTCPNVSNLYYPGDGEIFLDTSAFPTGVVAGHAPWVSAIVLAKRGGTPDISASFPTGNDRVLSVGFGSGQKVDGFNNITGAGDTANSYGLNILLRDAAGLIVAPSCGSNLPLTGVQTASIQGFLSKSSCFIATAAFRSIDAAPVAMLRRFRDEVLLTNPAGEAFVRWYYDWSPRSAEWLMEHPGFRYPVLQALIPVEVAAWLILHPVQLTLLFVFALSTLVLGSLFWLAMRARRELR